MRSDLLSEPDSPAYRAATSPHNSSVTQRPARVGHPRTAQEVAAVVSWAAERDLVVAIQASGHGAGAPMGSDCVLLDTSGLDSVAIDPATRTARVGAGATWATVNACAQEHGLLGRAGSSPSVAVAGYTFDGGVGWLSRPHGLASAALQSVDYVDGAGQLRQASEDASNPVDRQALWAFRGGGGVGAATSLTFELVAVQTLWAGYRLWDITALESLVQAWAGAVKDFGDALCTSLSVLHTPPGPRFPAALQGVPVVHLAFASVAGEHAAAPLLNALATAPAAALDSSWAPADAARLAEIHLDPPAPVPALGLGRWLGSDTPGLAHDLLRTAAPQDSALSLIELRNVANSAPTRTGAMTAVPSPFVLHAVGAAADASARQSVETALTTLQASAQPVDIGLAAPMFAEGRERVDDALPADILQQLGRAAAAVDPHQRFAPTRLQASSGGVRH